MIVFVLCLFLLARADSFPADYVSSRAEFRAYAHSPGHSFAKSYAIRSTKDSDLTIDVAYFGGHGRKLLILQSGIHGVEGPAGAAAQFLFFNKFLQSYLKQDIDVLFIHALDPFGYKYHRRTDEFNVNLNRNFFLERAEFNLANSDYADLRDILEPEHPLRGVRKAHLKNCSRLVTRLVTTGFARRKITAAMNSGQYQFRRGLNFGGVEPSEQVFILDNLLNQVAPGHDQIVFVDFHTGLGERGVLHLMPSANSSPKLRAELAEALNLRDSARLKITSAQDTGFFKTSGDVVDFVPQRIPPIIPRLSLTAEFGTMGTGILAQLESASLLIAENQAYFYGSPYRNTDLEIRKNFGELFNPDDPGWQAQVLGASAELFLTLAELFK